MSKINRIAVIADCHGCIDELEKLYDMLSHFSLDEVHSVGDLIDRGPSSGEVVDFCREKKVKLVRGNHEATMKSIVQTHKGFTKNEDKKRTIRSICATPRAKENWEYLFEAPYLRAVDELNLLIVHAGLWPWPIPIYKQGECRSVAHAQAINQYKLGDSVWYEKMAKKNEQEGKRVYIPWQNLYDHRENVVYGHSVYCHPNFKYNTHNKGAGWTCGIDTGVPFGGMLTAIVLPEQLIVQVRAKKAYWTKKNSKKAKIIPEPRQTGGYGE